MKHLSHVIQSMGILGFFILASCSSKETKTDTLGQNGANTATVAEAKSSSSELKPIYFGFDSYTLSKEAKNILKSELVYFQQHPGDAIQVAGNCDERGSTQYNLALGEKRANAAKSYLIELGMEPSKVSVVSYGSERPLVQGHDESAWAQDRNAAPVVLHE